MHTLSIYHILSAAGSSSGMDIIWQIQVCKKFKFFLCNLAWILSSSQSTEWLKLNSSSGKFSSPHLLGLCLNYGISVSKHQDGWYMLGIIYTCQHDMSYLVCHCLSKQWTNCWVEPQFLPQSPDGVSISLRVSYSAHIYGKYPDTPIICSGFFISVRLSLMNILFLYFHDILSWEKLCEETQSSECLQTPHNHFYFVVLFSSSSWPFPGSETQGHTARESYKPIWGFFPLLEYRV